MPDNSSIQDNSDEFLPVIFNKDSITFALDENDFKDFVVKLLGKPEVIQGHVKGAYEISFESFQNINYQIDKVVTETNDAALIEFVAELFFDDNSSIRFNGIHSFLSYQEVRPISCIGFNFTWTYLVKFKAEQPPQKQEISIYSDYLELESEESNNYMFENELKNLFDLIRVTHKIPKLYYSIRSTIPNWGMMVAQRVKLVLESNCLIEVGFKELRLKANQLFLITAKIPGILTVFIASIFVFMNLKNFKTSINSSFNSSKIEQIKSLLQAEIEENSSDSKKLDYLIELAKYEVERSLSPLEFNIDESSSSLTRLFFDALIYVFILVFSIICLSLLIKLPNWKFILFTDKSIKEKRTKLKINKQLEVFSIVGILVSILSGVFANYIFNFLTGNG